MASEAEIEYTQRRNPNTMQMQNCVIAHCTVEEHSSEPVWGHGPNSVKRALATLSEDCPCGESYHKAADGEDEDD